MQHFRVITFSDRELNEANPLIHTCKSNGLPIDVVTLTEDWKVNAFKIKLLYDYLQNKSEDMILLVVDAFDVIINCKTDQILSLFRSFKTDIVFAAEANYYFRNPKLRGKYFKNYPSSPTIYRFLNSGTFIGTCWALKALLQDIISENNLNPEDLSTFIAVRSDQYLYSKHFVDSASHKNPRYNIILDYNHELFEVTGGRMRVLHLPYLSDLHAYNAYKVERFLLKTFNLHHHQDAITDLTFDPDKSTFKNRLCNTYPPIIHFPGTWHNFDSVLSKLKTKSKTFSWGKSAASAMSLIAYLIGLFIPIRIKL
ncbi:MAG: glycosyltransferase domain-containing protein [Cyclobacteriaceae bacterium]